jgi:hypothetical protein
MATSKGLALVYGSGGTITLYTQTGVGPGTALSGAISTIESYDVTHEADVEQIKNGSGEVVAQVSANERISLNITFIPSSATDATAALTGASLPGVNSYVKITDAKATTYGGVSINGDYVYSGGGSVKFTNSGKAMVTMTVTKYPSLTGSATVYPL